MVFFQSVYFRLFQLWKIVFISVFLVLIKIIISDNFSFFLLLPFHYLRDWFYDFSLKLLMLCQFCFLLVCTINITLFYLIFCCTHQVFYYFCFQRTCYMLQFLRCNLRNIFDTKKAFKFFFWFLKKIFIRCVNSLNIKTILPSSWCIFFLIGYLQMRKVVVTKGRCSRSDIGKNTLQKLSEIF